MQKTEKMMQILNIAGYKFLALTDLATWRTNLHALCQAHGLKGTILLSTEGINLSLAAPSTQMHAFLQSLKKYSQLTDIQFHETYSEQIPFKKLKVKIKKEIIRFNQQTVDINAIRAPHLSPEELKQWLDDKREITLLDTRNDYEVELGTFNGAKDLNLKHFVEFPHKAATVDRSKPIVMFCTGGIRCEKAALYMLELGYKEVYQLDGGILGYFAKVGKIHYTGDCFIFDERVAVDTTLTPVNGVSEQE